MVTFELTGQAWFVGCKVIFGGWFVTDRMATELVTDPATFVMTIV
jgi:hypothetical protein